MNARVLNHRQVGYFLAIIDAGSLGRAASNLNISEPAISKSIRLLEDTLQVPLFDRTPRGLELTVFGRSLAEHARVAISELDRAVLDIAELRGAAAGHVYVGTTPSFTTFLLPKAIAELMETRPGIRVSVFEGLGSQLLPKLLHHEIDFIVSAFTNKNNQPEVRRELLWSDRAGVFVRASHPWTKKRNISLAEIADARWMLTDRTDQVRSKFDDIFAEHELQPPRPAVEISSLSFARALLQNSEVVTFLPRNVVSAELADGRVVPLDVPSLTADLTAGLSFRQRGSQPPACRELCRILRRMAETMDSDRR